MTRLRTQRMRLPRARGNALARPGTHALVLGGGIAGIAAATVLCERGVRVTLIERERELGGRAGGFEHRLASGERMQVERGFHAFFRQQYNLRALLARIDPELHMLVPVSEYPILGPGRARQAFDRQGGLPALRVLKAALRTPHLHAFDLARINGGRALEMLRFDSVRTYADFDRESADAYLSSLALPPMARCMLFDVLAGSVFNPEREMSAAELLMMLHCFFTGNPEGLLFDVARAPMGASLWQPFARWLGARGVEILTGTSAQRVLPRHGGGYRVEHASGSTSTDLLVLALDVKSLQSLLANGPTLDAELSSKVARLRVTKPFATLRLWLDRPLGRDRAVFAGTTLRGELDGIACYDRFQDESAAWAQRHRGAVVELHAHALHCEPDAGAVRADLIAGLHALYPESRRARVVSECFSLRDDCRRSRHRGMPSGRHRRPR